MNVGHVANKKISHDTRQKLQIFNLTKDCHNKHNKKNSFFGMRKEKKHKNTKDM